MESTDGDCSGHVSLFFTTCFAPASRTNNSTSSSGHILCTLPQTSNKALWTQTRYPWTANTLANLGHKFILKELT